MPFLKDKLLQPVFPSSTEFPIEMGVTTRDLPFFFTGTPDLLDPKKISPLVECFPAFNKGVFPEQIHGSKVKFLCKEDLQKDSALQLIPKADGLLTSMPKVTLAILTADCLPIFFLVPDPLMIGIVHAGWRGTAATIARSAVHQLRHVSRQSSKTFLVAFGPCIKGCCYQVGMEVEKLFGDTIVERDRSFYLDLVKENRQQLEKTGIREEHMGENPPCTSCHLEKFYSYRREKEKAGRMVSWIRIKSVVT